MALEEKVLAELRADLEESKKSLEGELSKFATKNADGEFKADFPEDLGSERSENANEVEEYTDRLALEKSLETQLTDVNDALARMDAGTYDTDEETGKEIDVDRLRAYPAARANVRQG